MKTLIRNQVYDINKSCEENCQTGPVFTEEIPSIIKTSQKTKLWNFELNSPLGIPAGPLFNSKFIKFYADFGWDILVYKTVRSISRKAHPNPNCVFVNSEKKFAVGEPISEIQISKNSPEFIEDLSITNSFGVNSLSPKDWMEDVEKANSFLHSGQIMPVSILGTPDLEERDLVEDFVYTAKMAVEAGAKIIIMNYSCPNVCTGEGSIYADAQFSAEISRKIRQAVGKNFPLVMKMGWLPFPQLEKIIKANRPFLDGFAGINTVPKNVKNKKGIPALPGKNRLKSGVCGSVIIDIAEDFAKNIVKIREEMNDDFVIFGVGGIMNVEQIKNRLKTGANIAMCGTSAMWNPFLAEEFKKNW